MKPSFFPKLLLVFAFLLISFSLGCGRKMVMATVGHHDSATVSSSDSKVAGMKGFHFYLDYAEAGPNFNGKSGLPFPTPPPPSPPPSPPHEA